MIILDNKETIEIPTTIIESIEESLKQIKEYEEGKRNLSTLKDSIALWKQLITDVEEEILKEEKGNAQE